MAFVVSSVCSPAAQQKKKPMQAAGAALLNCIGRLAIILGHSEGDVYLWVIADVRLKLVHATVVLEPTGPLFGALGLGGRVISSLLWGLTDIAIAYATLSEEFW